MKINLILLIFFSAVDSKEVPKFAPAFKGLCANGSFDSWAINSNFCLYSKHNQEFIGRHSLVRSTPDYVHWNFDQDRVLISNRSYYFTIKNNSNLQDFSLTLNLFHKSFYIDIILRATQLLSVCGHNNDTLGTSYGNDSVNLNIEDCYDFNKYSILYLWIDFVKIRFYQPYHNKLRVYEIYNSLVIERTLPSRGIKYLTRLILKVPGHNPDYLPIKIYPIIVVMKKCVPSKNNSNNLEDRRRLYDLPLYKSIRYLCDSIKYSGIYNIASSVLSTLRLYRNALLVREIDPLTNISVVKVKIEGRIELHLNKNVESFDLFRHYGDYLPINIKMWQGLGISVAPAEIVTIFMAHTVISDGCYVSFLNAMDGTFYTETLLRHTRISIFQTSKGVNFSVESVAQRPSFINLPSYILYNGSCIKSKGFSQLFIFNIDPHISMEQPVSYC